MQLLHRVPIFDRSSVAEKEMHSSRKGDHAGATPAGGTRFVGCPRSPMQRRRSQKPEVAGASPAVGTNSFALVAQWSRALGFDPRSCRFESCRERQLQGVLTGQANRRRLLSDRSRPARGWGASPQNSATILMRCTALPRSGLKKRRSLAAEP